MKRRSLILLPLIATGLFLSRVASFGVPGQKGLVTAAPLKGTDLHGDPLPPGAVGRLGSIRFHHPGGIGALAFSPDGRLILGAGSGKQGESCRVWETASGKELARFGAADEHLFPGVCFSPDGKAVAVGHEQSVKLFEWRTGKLLRVLGGPRHHATFAFSPDGKLLAICGWKEAVPEPKKVGRGELANVQHLIRVWDVATGRELPAFETGTARTHALRFTTDGKRLVSRCVPEPSIFASRTAEDDDPGFIYVWDVATRKKLHELACPTSSVAFSPDGNTIALQPGRRMQADGIRVVHLASGKTVCEIASKQASFGYTPDSKGLIAIEEQAISLWDPATGKLIRRFYGHLAEFPRLGGFSADGKLLAVLSGGWYQDGLVRLWDVATGLEIRTGSGHQDEVTCLAYAPDGKLLASGSRDCTVRFWDPATTRELRCLKGHQDNVRAVAFSPDGKTLASSSADGEIRLWNVAAGRESARLTGPVSGGRHLTFTADGKTLIASHETHYQVWELAAAGKSRRFEIPGKDPILAHTPDGEALLVADQQDRNEKAPPPEMLRLVHRTALQPLRLMPLHPCRHPKTSFPCVGVAVSADGKQFGSWQTVLTSNGPLPEGQGAALQVWERATGQEVFKVECVYFDAVTFARDGRLIAGSHSTNNTDWRCCRGGLTLWDAWTGDRLGDLPGHAAYVGGLAFAPDGKTLASASADHTILLWQNLPNLSIKSPRTPAPAQQLDRWWADLADGNPVVANRALALLVADPLQAVRLLGERLEPAARGQAPRIARLIKDLDSPRFATRQQASAGLEKLDEAALALRQALADNPSLEVRRRLEAVLGKVEQAIPRPAQLRSHRAITALQWLASPGARQVLEKLAGGAPEARQTREARAALEHLRSGRNGSR